MREQRGFDLARFDSVSPDLKLMVEASVKKQVPVGIPRDDRFSTRSDDAENIEKEIPTKSEIIEVKDMPKELTKDELNSPGGKKVVDMTLLKRPGQLNDVTSACVFLASDEQNYMTGQVLSISGGAYLG